LRILFVEHVTKALIVCLTVSVIAYGRKAKNAETAALVKDAGRLFQDLSRRSANTIPDAVLNRTKCVAAIPAIPAGTGHLNRRGVASCRETSDHWDSPANVTFVQNGFLNDGADLLFFILQDEAVKALQSGGLQIRPQKHGTAPLVSTTPIPSRVALDSELFVYEYRGNALSGSATGGVLRLDRSNGSHGPNPVLSEVPKKINEQYLSSLTSVFNTILPTGIVIHHTAIIPGENTLPRGKRDIDKYHETRGFEITCSGHVYHEAYHYLILPNGRVQAGRPERCEGAHAVGYNSYVGISVVGDFDGKDNPSGEKGPTQPTEKQIVSLVQLCRRLKDRYNIPLKHIVRHSDIANTRCPGDRFPFGSLLQKLQTSKPYRSKAGNSATK
jgi:N-acetylmuramoyl-L-alanine amidase